jgi:hypothetical protein
MVSMNNSSVMVVRAPAGVFPLAGREAGGRRRIDGGAIIHDPHSTPLNQHGLGDGLGRRQDFICTVPKELDGHEGKGEPRTSVGLDQLS